MSFYSPDVFADAFEGTRGVSIALAAGFISLLLGAGFAPFCLSFISLDIVAAIFLTFIVDSPTPIFVFAPLA
jgi:hypothetical protein